MKTKLFFICSLIVTAVTAQSKQETINWLNEKLSSSPYIYDGNSSYSKFLEISRDGKFTVTQPTKFQYSPSQNHTSIFYGSFSKLSFSSIKIKNINGNYYLLATCSSGKCITQISEYNDGKETFNSNDVVLGITSEYELAERCKKAIIHLIKLIGGKKEAF